MSPKEIQWKLTKMEESETNTDDEISNGVLNPERNLETQHGELTATIDDLRRQLNEALVDGNWNDGAEIQQTILLMLDCLNSGDLCHSAQCCEMYLRCAERMEQLSNRVRRRGNDSLADQYMAYASNYRNSM